MSPKRKSGVREFARALHQALRGKAPPNNQIEGLFLFRKHGAPLHATIPDPEVAYLTFIRSCLEAFQVDHPKPAELLSLRFLEKETVKSIASQLSLSQEHVYRQQRAAIEALAEWILAKEEQEKREFETSLINKLPPPSYTRLFGAEKIASDLADLLVPQKSPWVLALIGLGGMGKTALVDWTIRRLIPHFPYQELFWLRADNSEGHKANKQQLTRLLAQHFIPETIPFSEHLATLRKYLKAQPCLIVIDNLDIDSEDLDWIEVMQDLANPGKFVLTSRRLPSPLAQVYALPITELESQPAAELLVYEANQRGLQTAGDDLRSHAQEIYARTGGNPLALRLVTGLLQAWSLSTVLKALTERAPGDVEKMYGGIFEKSWQALGEAARQLLATMPLVGPEGALEGHLQAVSGLEEVSFHTALFELRRHSLLEMRGSILEPRYGLHNLTESFLHNKLGTKPAGFQISFKNSAQSNLDFWLAQLGRQDKIKTLSNEKGNLQSAVEFGLHLRDRRSSYQLLNAMAPTILELGIAQEWIGFFQRAFTQMEERETLARITLPYQLGALFWQVGQNEKALEAFRESLELSTQTGSGRQRVAAQLGICLTLWSAQLYEQASKEAQLAEPELQPIGEGDPLKIRGLAILGILAFAAKEYEHAGSFFQMALGIVPREQKSIQAQLRLNLGLSLQARGKFNKSLQEYDAAGALLKAVPRSDRVLATVEVLRASLHYKNNKMDAARAALERAARLLQVDEKDLEVLAFLENELGRVHFKAGETDKALSFFNSAANLSQQLGNG